MALDGAPAGRDIGVITLAVSAIMESLVVSATQVEIPLSQASSTITVITGEELRERQLATVADALRDVPGLTVLRAGSAGALTSVFPRGGESDYTLVYVDDIQVNAFGGFMDFAHLSTANIDRVEVVRGPQSALYGSNAIGSVVRIITRSGGPLKGDAALEGGSFGTMHVAASASGTTGNWFWGGGVDGFTSDGFNGQHTTEGQTIENDDYGRTQVGGSGGWRGTSGASLRTQLMFGRDERGFPGPFGSNPIGVFTGIDTVLARVERSMERLYRRHHGSGTATPRAWRGDVERHRQRLHQQLRHHSIRFPPRHGPWTGGYVRCARS